MGCDLIYNSVTVFETNSMLFSSDQNNRKIANTMKLSLVQQEIEFNFSVCTFNFTELPTFLR